VTGNGPLTQKVIEYQDMVRKLVTTAMTAEEWTPLSSFVAIDKFERVGTFLEVQNWQQYVEMLIGWGQSIKSFETTVKRVTEVPNLVYFEVEERHFYGDAVHIVNSLSVFEFDSDAKISHLDVFLQMRQPE
jgi:hypothetical protein